MGMVETLRATPPEPVRRAAMLNRWSDVSFLHWRVDPAVVRPLVDPALEIDTFDGSAWVGLVPFHIAMRPPFVPAVPVATTFPESNVRTYVRDATGSRGLWFLSLDVPRSAAVVAARLALGLPYAWSAMSIERRDGRIVYSSRRRAPSAGARSDVAVRVGGPIHRPDELALFLTARFRLFGRGPIGLFRVQVEHPPWSLHRAKALSVRDELVPAAGLPIQDDTPLVHASPGVDVRVAFPSAPRRNAATAHARGAR